VGALIVSARGLRSSTTRLQLATHLSIIGSTLVALHTHITHLPEEARVWTAEASATLQRTRESLLKLKRKIFAARADDDVNKIAFEITSMMAAGGPL
jgi:hypothetical protein